MKLIFDSKKLKEIVDRVVSVVDDNSELEAYRSIKIVTRGSGVLFSSIVSGISVEEFFPMTPDGEITLFLPGKRFQAIVSALLRERCTISSEDGKSVSISSGRSRFSIQSLRDSGLDMKWPDSDVEFSSYSVDEFLHSIWRCAIASERNQAESPELASVHFSPECVVATNKKFLAKYDSKGISTPGGITISRNHLEKISRIAREYKGETKEYAIVDKMLYLTFGYLRLSVTGLASNYPNFKVLTKASYPISFSIKKNVIAEEVLQILAAAGKDERVLSILVSSKGLHLSANYGVSTAETFIDCEIAIDKEMRLFLSADYLLSAVSHFKGEDITFGIRDERSPIQLKEPSYECIIAPRQGY